MAIYQNEIKQENCETGSRMCIGCKCEIEDKYVLNLMNTYWHETCLTCSQCGQYLQTSCYHKNMQLFCKDDYLKMFGKNCSNCYKLIKPNELVMRTSVDNRMYHADCFRCEICKRQLKKGDEYSMFNDKVLCRIDYEKLNTSKLSIVNSKKLSAEKSNKAQKCQFANNSNSSFNSNPSDEDDSLDEDGYFGNNSNVNHRRAAKRPRTILTSSQRRKFRDAFLVSPKPCRKVREQLGAETGLSVRVVQVWFQNERAKMKKLQRRQQQTDPKDSNLTGDDCSESKFHRLRKIDSTYDDDDEDAIDETDPSSDEDDNQSLKPIKTLFTNKLIKSSSASPLSNASTTAYTHYGNNTPQHTTYDYVQSSEQHLSVQHDTTDDIHRNMFTTLSTAPLSALSTSSLSSSSSSSLSSHSSASGLCQTTANHPLFSPGNAGTVALTSTLHYLINNNNNSTCSSHQVLASHPFQQFADQLIVKDEPNPIDRLYSMQNSYFCSKC